MRLSNQTKAFTFTFISAAGALAFACGPADYEGTPLRVDGGTHATDPNEPGGGCSAGLASDDPTKYPQCSGPKGGQGRCVPKDKVGSFASQFVDGGCASGNICVPESLVKNGTTVELKKCKPVIGQSAEDGRCFSTLANDVIANYDLLKGATGDQCGADEVCAPCVNPLKGNAPTGVCFKASSGGGCKADAGGGGATSPTSTATCPYNGPPIVDVNTFPVDSCGAGMRCVPTSVLPSPDLAKSLKTCGQGVCAPEKQIAFAGNYVPKTCASVAGAEGRCTNENVPAVAAQKSMLPKDVCDAGELCAPCYSPIDGAPTGACATAKCDAPKQPAKTFGGCCGSPARGKCIPKSMVPSNMSSNLGNDNGTCTNQTVCVPSEFVTTPGYKGTACTGSTFLFGGYNGVCLSNCLEFDFFQSLGISKGSCSSSQKCVPCQNPLDGSSTGAPGCPGT